jgi:hypothetical protein
MMPKVSPEGSSSCFKTKRKTRKRMTGFHAGLFTSFPNTTLEEAWRAVCAIRNTNFLDN